MQLLEHEGKALLAEHGIKVPTSHIARSTDAVAAAAADLGLPIMLKAQVPSGRRGKHGGIALAKSIDEAHLAANRILGSRLGDDSVAALLVEQAVDIDKEFYLSVYFDRRRQALVVIASNAGGMEVEELSGTDDVIVDAISLLRARQPHEFQDFCRRLGVRGPTLLGISDVLSKLVTLALSRDAVLAEINPLAVTKHGDVIALDAKITIDESSYYRQSHWMPPARDDATSSASERAAKAVGISYVPLDGEVAIVANGTGLALNMMDLLAQQGSSAANFMDVGPVDRPDKIQRALELCLEQERVLGLCINLYGGATDCRMVAEAILKTLQSARRKSLPRVVRMCGHGEEEGWALLENAGVAVVRGGSTEEAVRKIIAQVGART